MAQAIEQAYTELHRQLAHELPGHDTVWLQDLRAQALAHFASIGLPSARQEAWKYTRLTPLLKEAYRPAAVAQDDVSRTSLQQLPWAELDAVRLVFVDGLFSVSLSDLTALTKGATIVDLARAVREDSGHVREKLAECAMSGEALTVLNTAFVGSGVLIDIAQGCDLSPLIHLHYVSSGADRVACYAHNFVMMAPHSRATVLETYHCPDGEAYVTNIQMDVTLAEGAHLDHYKLQLEGSRCTHLATARIEQERSSRYQNHVLALGAGLMRNDLQLILKGQGAEAVLDGVFLAKGRQHKDMQIRIDHTVPSCVSHTDYHGIAEQGGRGVFGGRVKVHPQAQLSNARMLSRNLLLSRDAEIDTRPQLEIFADDVKCSHGATIGQLDEEALFYLRSRGIDEAQARNLVVYAFAAESIEQYPNQILRKLARQLLINHLPQGNQLQELLG